MENNKTEILKNQLAQAHDSWKLCYSQCSTVKKWCLTLWSAVVLWMISGKLNSPSIFLSFLFFGVFFLGFFVLEAIFAEPMYRIVEYQKYIANQFRSADMKFPKLLVDYLDAQDNRLNDLLGAIKNHRSGWAFYGFLFFLSILVCLLR